MKAGALAPSPPLDAEPAMATLPLSPAPPAPPPAPAEQGVLDDAWITLLLLAAVVAWDFSGLDIVVSRHFGNSSGFAWRHHPLAAVVLHDWARNLGWVLAAALALGAWRPWGPLVQLQRGQRLWWLGTTLGCAALIPLLKRASLTSCPWSLAEFGGIAHRVPHWMFTVPDGGPGGCFPSGHAATAFAFLPAWFALRAHSRRAAHLWLWGTLAAGAVLGATQVLRGAHYVSHSLWTAWICWTVSALAHHIALAARSKRHGGFQAPRQEP